MQQKSYMEGFGKQQNTNRRWRKREGWGETVKLGSLFDKYRKNLRAPEQSVIQAFCEVVEEVVGVSIKTDHVRYTPQSKTLYVASTGPLKNEIFLHKEEVIAHLKGRLGEQNAPQTIL